MRTATESIQLKVKEEYHSRWWFPGKTVSRT
jgi:hypothetical protein